jgi:tetratricopeptide (TPR) repeat protein
LISFYYLEKSIEYLIKSLELKQIIFGTIHPEYAAALNNLGSTYLLMKNLKESKECFSKSLETFEQVIKEDHPLIAKSYFDLGKVNSMLKNNQTAIECFKKSLDMRKKLYKGLVNQEILNSLDRLADELYCCGKIEEALPLYQELLSALYQKYENKPDHPWVSKTFSRIKACSIESKDKSKFRNYILQSVTMKSKAVVRTALTKMISFRGPVIIILSLYVFLFLYSLFVGEFYFLD